MISILKYGEVKNEEIFARTLPTDNVSQAVAEILAAVRREGDKALLEYEKRFDKAELPSLLVSEAEIREALALVDPAFLDILKEAAANIRAFHEKQKRTSFLINDRPGIVMGQKVIPLDRVGLYVPGGTAAYPSTVLMDAIPAKIAGCRELVITTLEQEGAPRIRYRTHDLTRIIPDTEPCPCGRSYPRIDVILGRTDDMGKVKGVNIYPGQIDDVLKELPNASSEYKVEIDHENGKDRISVFVETALSGEEEKAAFEKEMKNLFKTRINVTILPKAVAIGELPRSEKKSTRIFDYRY